MRRDIQRRLEELEQQGTDWISTLKFIDYDWIVDYDNDRWDEVFFDDFITVVRSIETGEVRGYYNDRRTDAEKVAAGGNLAFL